VGTLDERPDPKILVSDEGYHSCIVRITGPGRPMGDSTARNSFMAQPYPLGSGISKCMQGIQFVLIIFVGTPSEGLPLATDVIEPKKGRRFGLTCGPPSSGSNAHSPPRTVRHEYPLYGPKPCSTISLVKTSKIIFMTFSSLSPHPASSRPPESVETNPVRRCPHPAPKLSV
jgi:hypothetical protein